MNANSNISIFNSDNFGELRIVMQDGEPWFVAADVCRALDITNAADAVAKRLRGRERRIATIYTKAGNRDMTIVSESGMYRLIFHSRKEEAEQFQDWVVEVVLPSIRKDGGYLHVINEDNDITILNKAFAILKTANEKLEKQLAEAAPKAETYEKYIDKGGNESVYTVAKEAQGAGIDVAPREFFDVLHYKQVLCGGKGVNHNKPRQNYIKAGYMTTKPIPPEKWGKWNCVPLITPKGMAYFLSKMPEWVAEYRAYEARGKIA